MKSTYSLILAAEAEEKGRSIFELAVYGLAVLCMAVAGWQFASSPVIVPGTVRTQEAPAQSVIANASPEVPVKIASRG